jgi:hypothetical protein
MPDREKKVGVLRWRRENVIVRRQTDRHPTSAAGGCARRSQHRMLVAVGSGEVLRNGNVAVVVATGQVG